jgi:ribosomal protein L16 Arg81 hydroxylase
MFDFTQLVSPVPVKKFLREYWEKKPLIVRRDDSNYYASLLRLQDLDSILNDSSPNNSHIQAVRDGKPRTLKTNDSSLGGSGPESYYEEYRAGSTLVFQSLHQRWPALRSLCWSLAREFSAGAQVNVYLTPPNSRGFTEHYDTHDVFVVQVHGQKRWQVFERPIKSPLHGQPYDAGAAKPGKLLHEVELTAGSLLYLPRGYVHSAVSDSSASVHLALGLLTMTWATSLLHAVESTIESDVRYRMSLPPGFARDAAARSGAARHLAKLLRDLADRADCDAAIADAITRAGQALPVDLEGHLADIELESGIKAATRLQVRPGAAASLVRLGSQVALEFHGKRVTMPEHAGPALQFVLKQSELRAADLPDALDEAGKLVLVRRLVREGYLTVADGKD